MGQRRSGYIALVKSMSVFVSWVSACGAAVVLSVALDAG